MNTQSKLFVIMVLLLISSSVSAFKVSPVKFELEIPKGQSKEITLNYVGSEGSEAKNLEIFPTDISMLRSGAFQFYRREEFNHSAVPWVSFDKEKMRLIGTEEEKFRFDIEIPRNATPGEYYVAIMSEPTEFTNVKSESDPFMLKMKSRVAIVIIINVPGRDHKREGEVHTTEVKAESDKVHLMSTFENKGNIHLDVTGKATIRSENKRINFGEIPLSSRSKKPGEEHFIFPKNLLDFHGTLEKQLPKGEYVADISFDYGLDYRKAKDQVSFKIERGKDLDESEMDFISVKPEKLRLGIKDKAFRTKTIEISNTYNGNLDVSAQTNEDWLRVAPLDITLRPGQTRTIKAIISVKDKIGKKLSDKIVFNPGRGRSIEIPVEVMTPELLKETEEREAEEKARKEREEKERAEREAKEKAEKEKEEKEEREASKEVKEEEDSTEKVAKTEEDSLAVSGKDPGSTAEDTGKDPKENKWALFLSLAVVALFLFFLIYRAIKAIKKHKFNSKNSSDMRHSNFLFVAILMLLISSCSVKKQTIEDQDLPKKEETPVLSKDSIQKLEQKELKETEEMAKKLSGEKEERLSKQPKVSNVFTEASIRSVLMDISTQTGVNIIPDETVEGNVSVELNEVPLGRALQMVLFPGGFDYKRIETDSEPGYYYLVGSSLPESFSFDALSETKVIKTNMDAEKVIKNLSNHFDPYVTTTENGNSITISGSPEMVERIKTDIKRIDRSRRQIEISAVVATIQWKEGSNLGMNWGSIDISGSGSMDFPGSADYAAEIVGNVKNLVKMRDERASVSVKAEPSLVVSEGEEANIQLTQEHLFMIMSGGGMNYNYFTTEEFETGVKMDVKPQINRDGTIQLKVAPEVADIIGEREFKVGGNGNQKLPIISRRSETTNVSLENGETFALGGLMMDSQKESVSGTPIMRSIPPISFFFKNKEKEKINTEMVIFITPKIIK